MKKDIKQSKQKNVLLFFAAIVITLLSLQIETFAATATTEQFDAVIRKELSAAKTPNAVVSVIKGKDANYLSYSAANGEAATDEYALFQIGSVSKQFTGLGILLLEDNGLLSLDDPVSEHLPWFKVLYNGQGVSPDELTIADCLYQTSGFTNDETRYPAATSGMSLEDSVRQINESELAFYPSEQFSYANANYRILGLIIEAVSGQSYDDFMTECILLPLGLDNTYASPSKAQNIGKIVEGSRLSFLLAWPYAIPVADGNVPAGYIYSCAKDISRWIQIHLGVIDVPEQFQRIIKKSHEPNIHSVVDNSTYYAAGWYVNAETGAIYHSGGTPNYSAYVEIRFDSYSAVCVLTNMNASANTNNLGASILDILDGKVALPNTTDIWNVFDLIFSSITFVCILGFFMYLFAILRKIRRIRAGELIKKNITLKNIKYFILPSVLALLTILAAVLLPIVFGSPWSIICFWGPISLPSGLISLFVLLVCAFFFSYIATKYKVK